MEENFFEPLIIKEEYSNSYLKKLRIYEGVEDNSQKIEKVDDEEENLCVICY